MMVKHLEKESQSSNNPLCKSSNKWKVAGVHQDKHWATSLEATTWYSLNTAQALCSLLSGQQLFRSPRCFSTTIQRSRKYPISSEQILHLFHSVLQRNPAQIPSCHPLSLPSLDTLQIKTCELNPAGFFLRSSLWTKPVLQKHWLCTGVLLRRVPVPLCKSCQVLNGFNLLQELRVKY